MNLIYIICSFIAFSASVFIIYLFAFKLRRHLGGFSWFFIMLGHLLGVYKNAIITYLVLWRPGPPISIILIASFFIVKAIQNSLWASGFYGQYRNFERAEELGAYYLYSDNKDEIKELSGTLVEDLDEANKQSRDKSN